MCYQLTDKEMNGKNYAFSRQEEKRNNITVTTTTTTTARKIR
jgi:hypothetical protein